MISNDTNQVGYKVEKMVRFHYGVAHSDNGASKPRGKTNHAHKPARVERSRVGTLFAVDNHRKSFARKGLGPAGAGPGALSPLIPTTYVKS